MGDAMGGGTEGGGGSGVDLNWGKEDEAEVRGRASRGGGGA